MLNFLIFFVLEKNVCKLSFCKNDGECVEIENNYKCYCRFGFIGKYCEG